MICKFTKPCLGTIKIILLDIFLDILIRIIYPHRFIRSTRNPPDIHQEFSPPKVRNQLHYLVGAADNNGYWLLIITCQVRWLMTPSSTWVILKAKPTKDFENLMQMLSFLISSSVDSSEWGYSHWRTNQISYLLRVHPKIEPMVWGTAWIYVYDVYVYLYIYINIRQPYLTDLTDLFQHRPFLPILSSRPSSSATPQRILTERGSSNLFQNHGIISPIHFRKKKCSPPNPNFMFWPLETIPNFETTKLVCQHSSELPTISSLLYRIQEICCGDALTSNKTWMWWCENGMFPLWMCIYNMYV